MRRNKLLWMCLLLVMSSTSLMGQELEDFKEKVTSFTLDNGLTFLVIERHDAPVASFVTHVDVGAANEPLGQSGIAHIFEHMAFKGSTRIGTSNWEKEKVAIEKMDAAYQAWLKAKNNPQADSTKMQEKWDAFVEYQEEAKEYVVNNEFSQIIDRNGGVGLNAGTSSDYTVYFYSLPSNKTELWFSLEAERFKDPVFREFYVEKDVVKEERRMRTDSSPIGRLLEEFLAVAYTAHPYGITTIGWPSDIEATTIEEAREFYEDFYVPSNMVIAIAGDVYPDEIKEMAETYFGDIPKGEDPPELMIREPEQRGERRFVIESNNQPWYMSGYHTVSAKHEDSQALNMLSQILSGGRTSRLYKRMVEEDQSALNVGAFNGFPGDKYQSLFLTFVIPNQGVEMDRIEATLEEEIQRIKDGDISKQELERVKTNIRANFIRGLDSNQGLAQRLASNQAIHGDWTHVFDELEMMESVTIEDIQRVAQKYLVKKNRTVGMIKNTDDDDSVAKAEQK